MKKIITIICTLLISSTTMASSERISDLLAEDSYERLSTISELKADLEKKEIALSAIEKDLNEQVIKASKQKSAKILLGIGAAGLAATALFIKFPMGSKSAGILSGIGDVIANAMLGFAGFSVSTVVTVTGAVKYFLNVNDAKDFAEKARLAKIAVKEIQSNLNHEIIQLCKVDSRHKLCY